MVCGGMCPTVGAVAVSVGTKKVKVASQLSQVLPELNVFALVSDF